jgi:hypothetical protein
MTITPTAGKPNSLTVTLERPCTLRPEEIDTLIDAAKQLRKGHKLNPLSRGAYVLLIDEENVFAKSEQRLRRELSCCSFRRVTRIFRNYDNGVTFDLEGRTL